MSGTGPIKAEFHDIPVMLAGSYKASTGEVAFTNEHISDIAATPIPSGGIPIIIGHEAEKDDQAPAVGFATSLKVDPLNPSQLLASGGMNQTETAIHAQEGGAFSRRSAGLSRHKGRWQLQHIALLGAKDPAIPNLPGIKPEQMAFLSADVDGETFYLKAPVANDPKEDDMPTDNDSARLAKDNEDLQAKLAAAESEKAELKRKSDEQEAELARFKTEETDVTTRLATMERQSRDGEAEKYINSLPNLKDMPRERRDGLALLQAMSNGDEKVRLSSGKDAEGKEQVKEFPSVAEGFKAFLASLVPPVETGPFALLSNGEVPAEDMDGKIEQRVQAHLSKYNLDPDQDDNYFKAVEAVAKEMSNGR